MRFYGNAIKEGIDSLPAGILFYWQDGSVKLYNEKMERLCHRVTNAPLTNALVFMDALRGLRLSGDIQNDEEYMIALSDGQTLLIKSYEESLEGERIFEVNAFDVTEEMRLNEELRKKREEADEVNRHLLTFSLEAKYHAMEKEALSAKILIHDELGHILLYMKRYMSGERDVGEAELFARLKKNLLMLKTGGGELWNQPYFICLKQAKELGVAVECDGRLPFADKEAAGAADVLQSSEQEAARQRELIRITEAAILAHTTNVLRHTRGSRLYIRTERAADGFRLTFTNDGGSPTEAIREGTGLSNLRQSVERIGGTMRIEATPAYRCEIFLPYENRSEL